MKKQFLFTLAFATTLLASCSLSDSVLPQVTPPAEPEETPSPITLSAGINVSSAPQARAILTGTEFPANNNDAFRITAYEGTAAPTAAAWGGAPYFAELAAKTDGAKVIALTTPKYYPATGKKLYFYAYAPGTGATYTAGTGSTPPTAKWTLADGQTDILWDKEDKGIAKPTAAGGVQEQPAFNFVHKLMKLNFVLKKDNSFQGTTTALNVTKIEVKDGNTVGTLNLDTGAMTWATSGTVTINPTTGNTMTATGATLGQSMLVAPNATVKLSITTGDGTVYPDKTINLTPVDSKHEGVSYTITLTFKQNDIVPTAAITDWKPGTPVSGDII